MSVANSNQLIFSITFLISIDVIIFQCDSITNRTKKSPLTIIKEEISTKITVVPIQAQKHCRTFSDQAALCTTLQEDIPLLSYVKECHLFLEIVCDFDIVGRWLHKPMVKPLQLDVIHSMCTPHTPRARASFLTKKKKMKSTLLTVNEIHKHKKNSLMCNLA